MNAIPNRIAGAATARVAQRGSAFATKDRYAVLVSDSIPNALRWAFFLFVFTIPFEEASVIPGSLSVVQISGVLLFGLFIFYYNPFSSKRSFRSPPPAVWWFLGYLVVYGAHGIFLPRDVLGKFLSRFITLFQVIISLWISVELLRHEKIARTSVLIFCFSTIILAFGMMFAGLGYDYSGRESALDYNPDTLGAVMALAAVGLIGVRLNSPFKHAIVNMTVLALILPLLLMVVRTGGRIGLAVFVIGCSVYLPIWQSKRKLLAIFLLALAIGGAVYVVGNNPEYVERWNQTYYEGNVSGRDRIYSASIDMGLERPIFGWQPVLHWYELGSRLGKWERDEHSLVLHLWLEVGLVGMIPFLVGLWLCGKDAWNARKGRLGGVPLALLLGALLNNVTDTGIAKKTLWFILALSLAVASKSASEKIVRLYSTK